MRSCTAALAVLALAAPAAAAPLTISHSGYLLDGADQPVTQSGATMEFSIWKSADTADASFRVWPAAGGASCRIDVTRGFYSVVLGAPERGCGGALTSDAMPYGEGRWLEVTVNGSRLTPRLQLGNVPTAAVAATALDAEKLGGLAPSGYWAKSEDLAGATYAGGTLSALVATLPTLAGDNAFGGANSFAGATTFGTADDTTTIAGGTITAKEFSGHVTGDVTGNVAGNVTGNLTGNVTGALTGSVAGDGSALTGLGAAKVGDAASPTIAAALASKVAGVGAGAGVSVTGAATSPVVGVTFGAAAGTVAQGNDPRFSDARAPIAGSNFYVQNKTPGGTPQAGAFDVSGDGRVGGALTVGGSATVAGTVTAASLAGNGANVTNVNAAKVGSATVADLHWSNINAAATGACAAIYRNQGCCGHVVLPAGGAATNCNAQCAAYGTRLGRTTSCAAEVAIWSRFGNVTALGQEVGSFYNYGCTGSGGNARTPVGGDPANGYFEYCCCVIQ